MYTMVAAVSVVVGSYVCHLYFTKGWRSTVQWLVHAVGAGAPVLLAKVTVSATSARPILSFSLSSLVTYFEEPDFLPRATLIEIKRVTDKK
jgi:hypothetical protein